MCDEVRTLGPGKFSTVPDEYVWQVSLDSGGCDEELSMGEGMGWAGLFRNGRTVFKDHDPGLEELNEAERALIQGAAIIILREDEQGFASVSYYEDEEEGVEAWEEVEAEFLEVED